MINSPLGGELISEDAQYVLADMLAQIDSWMNGAGRPRSK
jgi:hypothetical protein